MQMIQKGRILLLSVMVFTLLTGGQAVTAETPPSTAGERFITIDFENVDINLFIKYISELTGKNFIVDKTVKGNVTIVSPTKISEQEAYRVFESVLDVHGFTTVEAGSVIKILPAVKARSENIRTFQSDRAQHPEDKIVTQLIPLKHTTPDEIKKVLAPLVSKTSVVIAHTQSGMLIVTESLSNIQRLMAIIEAIDVAYTGEEIVVLPLRYASTDSVSKVLNSIFQKIGKTAKSKRRQSTITVVPYDRINALIVVATPTDIMRVKKLVNVLDAEMQKDSGNIHVYYLQHATAAELAKVLNFLPGQQASGDSKENKGKAPAISRNVDIMADEETNSLIIKSSRNEYDTLAEVIKKLDIPRRMVFLEALILEVSTTKNFEVGVEWAFGGVHSDGTGRVTSGFSGESTPFGLLSNIGENSPPAATGLTFGVLQQGIKIGGVTFPNIGAIIRAFKNDSDTNIVSTPQILTTDNKTAEISVGENVPYQVSQSFTENNQLFENFEYRDVSTKLTITPHINQAETLRLEIATEVTRLQSNTNDRPVTFKRTADTTVIVRDNDTVVIGGIIGQDITESNTRVPLLGDIPILGRLFRSDDNESTQTNMFIFITPRIIKNPADIASVTVQKETEIGKVMPEVKKEIYKDVNLTHAVRLSELGYDKMRAGLNSEAKNYFFEALEIDPDNPYAHYNLGVIFEEEGDKARAFKSYQKVIMSGTAMTAVDASQPDKIGVPLIQLAKENIDRMGRVETSEDELFLDEEGK